MAHSGVRRVLSGGGALIVTLGVAVAAAQTASGEDPTRAEAIPAAGRSLDVRSATPKLAPGLAKADGPVAVFVELNEQPAADAFAAERPKGKAAATKASRAAKAKSERKADVVVADAKAADPRTTELYRTSNAVAAVAVVTDAEGLPDLAARPDVVSIRRIVPKRLENAEAVQLTRAVNVWQSLGLVGQGMRVGIIDTGIDYTHSNFGGPGTAAAYDAIDSTVADPSYFPTAKVVGGYDFAGDDYDAVRTTRDITRSPTRTRSTATATARTSPARPAGSASMPTASTFDGAYADLDRDALEDMRIGPGTAPGASLYALKVFG